MLTWPRLQLIWDNKAKHCTPQDHHHRQQGLAEPSLAPDLTGSRGWGQSAAEAGAVLTIAPLLATAQRLHHLQPGRRDQSSPCTSVHPLPRWRGLGLGGGSRICGVNPNSHHPRRCCNPSQGQNPEGPNQSLRLDLGKLPESSFLTIPPPCPALSVHSDPYRRSVQPGSALTQNKCD